jgi:hypothetical protein
MSYHRGTFYEVRRAFQVGGVAALVEEKRGPRNPHPNRVAPEIEEKILDYALTFPTHGPQRVSNELRLAGTEVELWRRPCNAPAEPAHLTLLMQKPQQASSSPVPDADAGCCKSQSSRQ